MSYVINVKEAPYGAKGDNSADDADAILAAYSAAYGPPNAPNGHSTWMNRPVYFPNGRYRTTKSLLLRSVRGAHIFGAGRFATQISGPANLPAIVTNGFEYSCFEDMTISTSGTGSCFELDWDNTGPTALQSNTFNRVFFGGGEYGLSIGKTGHMGSETTLSNCFFASHTVAGLATRNYNALQQTMIGGNIQSCAIGILVWSGSVPIIQGVGFQNFGGRDILVNNTVGDSMTVSGCRSESSNFIKLHNGASATVSSCTHLTNGNHPAGEFANIEAGGGVFAGSLCLDNNYSLNGVIKGNGLLYGRGNLLKNPAHLTGFAGTVKQWI